MSADDTPGERNLHWAVLPAAGKPHLCAVNGGHVEALVPLAGRDQPHFFPSKDGRQLAVLDHNGKRAGLFDVVPEPPWIQPVLPFAFLGARQIGHTALPVNGTLIVGGRSRSGESLWRRTPGTSTQWTTVPLPEQLGFPGKAIDGLHLHDNALIVVDDLIMPLWMMVYAIGDPCQWKLQRLEQLPVHTTYERVTHSSLGPSGLAAISRGINHGTFSIHIWVLDLVGCRETACWSSSRFGGSIARNGNQPVAGGQSDAREALLEARMVVEYDRHLVVACGEYGAVRIRLDPDAAWNDDDALSRLPTPGLATCDSIVVASPFDGAGVFLVGKSTEGTIGFQWLSGQALRGHGATVRLLKGGA